MPTRREMPNAENCSLAELETAMKASRSVRDHTRMLAIRALLLGQPFEVVVLFVGKSEKTLSRWIIKRHEKNRSTCRIKTEL